MIQNTNNSTFCLADLCNMMPNYFDTDMFIGILCENKPTNPVLSEDTDAKIMMYYSGVRYHLHAI